MLVGVSKDGVVRGCRGETRKQERGFEMCESQEPRQRKHRASGEVASGEVVGVHWLEYRWRVTRAKPKQLLEWMLELYSTGTTVCKREQKAEQLEHLERKHPER